VFVDVISDNIICDYSGLPLLLLVLCHLYDYYTHDHSHSYFIIVIPMLQSIAGSKFISNCTQSFNLALTLTLLFLDLLLQLNLLHFFLHC